MTNAATTRFSGLSAHEDNQRAVQLLCAWNNRVGSWIPVIEALKTQAKTQMFAFDDLDTMVGQVVTDVNELLKMGQDEKKKSAATMARWESTSIKGRDSTPVTVVVEEGGGDVSRPDLVQKKLKAPRRKRSAPQDGAARPRQRAKKATTEKIVDRNAVTPPYVPHAHGTAPEDTLNEELERAIREITQGIKN